MYEDDDRSKRLGDRSREWIHEGNVRHIVVRREGERVVELPMTVAIAGTLLAPWLALLGVVAALLTGCSIEVQRVNVPEEPLGTPEDVIPG